MSKNIAILDEYNKVINIILCNNDYIIQPNEIEYFESNPAFIDGDFHNGFFYPEQPYESWTREQGNWIPPTPKPVSEGNWQWNETSRQWED